MLEGLIMKSQGGFYDVEVMCDGAYQVFSCRARGLFRKDGIVPKVGDCVSFQAGKRENKGEVGTIAHIHDRKNELVRPLLANLDLLFLLNAPYDPAPNLMLTDQLIATAEHKGITPIIIFTKNDLKPTTELEAVYRGAGFPVFSINHSLDETDQNVCEIKAIMQGNISAFIGNSGVGKSSLINLLYPQWNLQTGDISQKLGRGRHTTRHVELHRLSNGGYVADTPGFGTMDLLRYQPIKKEQLEGCFREFSPYLGACKFTGCSHTVEKGCAVLQALDDHNIQPTRHKSYCMMYESLRQVPDWQQKKH